MRESVTGYSQSDSGLIVRTERNICKITFLTEHIIRVKYCFSEELSPDRSYAVLLTAEEPGQYGFSAPEQVRVTPPHCSPVDHEEFIELSTAQSKVLVHKDPFGITIKDKNGNAVHRDILERAYTRDKNDRRRHYFALDGFDSYYGFGEKAGELNKFKKRLRMYCCDTLGYDSEKTDPLYKHIPFFIKRDTGRGLTCGMFYDCPEAGVFDLGCERSGYWEPYAYFSCDGGDMDYYVILGDSMKDVVRRYTDLTGKTIMPALHTLGYMASTMYYTEYDRDADKGIEKFVTGLNSRGFSCDGFHLSSGYTSIGKKRYVFHWNKDRFPNPKAFAQWMNGRKVPVSANIKPALLTDHPLYGEFASNGAFIMDKNTGKPHLERYWGGMASLVDFSSPDGRRMWKKYLKRQLLDVGITAVWDDNNEYELSDETAVCDGGGRACLASSMKPAFANLMARTAQEALHEHDGAMRPYILSRSGYAGIQRYAQTWTGDNYTSWHNLKYGIPVVLGMGLSGVANNGCDIGGFQGPAPDGELFLRWVQNGIFQPRFCIHSCNTDNTVTQPWSYAGYTEYVRDAFKLRYRLGYYLYSLFRIAATRGDPVMRPMIYEFERDNALADDSFDFMFGPFLLVANVLEQGARTREVYLPKGTAWYDWHTHKKFEGGRTVTVDTPLDKIPMFYKSGSIIPLIRPGTHMETGNFKEVRLLIEASEQSAFILYQDDGETTRYQDGDYLETEIDVCPESDCVDIAFSHKGDFADLTENFEIELAGRFEAPLRVEADGKALPLCIDSSDYDTLDEGCYFELSLRHATIKFRNPRRDFTLHISFAIKDLIGM